MKNNPQRFESFTRMVFQGFCPPSHLPGNKKQKYNRPLMKDGLEQ
jgi:hypothetical protein